MPQPASQLDEYLLGHGANEEKRLRRQAPELAPDSRRILDQLDIRLGDRAPRNWELVAVASQHESAPRSPELGDYARKNNLVY